MAEKEVVLDSEEDQDLHSIQTLLRQHEALEVGNTHQYTGTRRSLGGRKYKKLWRSNRPHDASIIEKMCENLSFKGQLSPKSKLNFLLFPVSFKHLDIFFSEAVF